MSNPLYTFFPAETQSSDALVELALNLRWSWSHTTGEIWGRLDPDLWELTQNPWLVLQTVSQERLQAAWADPAFTRRVDEILGQRREAEKSAAWFQNAHPNAPLKLAAYFSMEYMLSEALPIYSGGLGNVAGDQLKAVSDLGVPVVGIGLLYQQGYFRQEIDANGAQQALYPFNDPGQLPVRPVREANGEWLRLTVSMPGIKLWIRAWEVRVGRATLYLLDSNDPANPPAYRSLTSQLYGGGPDVRLRQEAMLGIAGCRLLGRLGLHPDVCHLNEGHAAFAVLERARAWMVDNQQPFDVALAVTRAGNVFTTHTAVSAGFDRFAPELMTKYFAHYAEHRLGISMKELLALGRDDPNDNGEPFNMAYLAMRGSGTVNGVSRLHGEVSRRLFQPLYPRRPLPEVPVGHVTNGIHTPTWESAEAHALWTEACGPDCWLGEMQNVEPCFRKMSDGRLWQYRTDTVRRLIGYVRKRLVRQRAAQGATAEEVAEVERIFDPGILTLGFARRFATYKRPNLLLRDPDRLARILTNSDRPVQLILAGKAHPQDLAGQELIRQWNDFIRRTDVRPRVAFVADYDMLLTQQLVQGVDVWINTPRRPWEACGTSGMKALANGGLNLSELDGWWAEAYTPEVGWAIGDGRDRGDDPAWDDAEARHLYQLLESEVIPLFYTRDATGMSPGWVAKMRESMARLTPQYSANRTVREYTEWHYLPAAAAYRERAADRGKRGAEILAWQRELAQHWPELRFGSVQIATHDNEHSFEVQVYLNGLNADAVEVQLYADSRDGMGGVVQPMTRVRDLEDSGHLYAAKVPALRPAGDYTPRIVPHKDGASVPLEAPQILWQR
jgi:glycogen phosphorylase